MGGCRGQIDNVMLNWYTETVLQNAPSASRQQNQRAAMSEPEERPYTAFLFGLLPQLVAII
jgi:hypothetical protein